MRLLLATDSQLVRRCLNGEAQAFDLLYNRHASDVYRLLYRLSRDKTQADDVTQDTLIAAFRSLGNWRQNGTFRSWLFGIAVRQHRKSACNNLNYSAEALEETVVDTAPLSDPLDYVTHKQALELIEQAIADLPDIYREVFVMLRVERLKQLEAAEILSIPVGTVQSRLGRGVSLLRRRICELGLAETTRELPANAGPKL